MPRKKNTIDTNKVFDLIKDDINSLRIKQDEIVYSIKELKDGISNLEERFKWIQLKNGSNRIILKLREEFYQEIYDKLQAKFILVGISKLASYILTILLVINLIIQLFFK